MMLYLVGHHMHMMLSSLCSSSGYGTSFGYLLPTIFLSVEENPPSHGPMLYSTCMSCMDS
jgi:hypothetical protein